LRRARFTSPRNAERLHQSLELLKGCVWSEEAVATFMRACILFWILGATDAMRKVSVANTAGGGVHAAPIACDALAD
jgi:hypothetical protein